MSEFTKGPWIVNYGGTMGHIKSFAPHPKDWTPTVCIFDIGVVGGGGKKYYAIEDENERMANAHLISACPEMYEALVLAQERIKELCLKLYFAKVNYDETEVLDKIERVLSKAEGKE